MKKVSFWRWRYPDPATGRWRRTLLPMTAQEALRYPGAEPIEGTLIELEIEEHEFADTSPSVRTPPKR
jgi:hypothetical protein